MHNKNFINSYNSLNKQMYMNYSIPSPLYSIRTKREIAIINKLVNNRSVTYKNTYEPSKSKTLYKNEVDNLRSVLDKTQIEKNILTNERNSLKQKLEALLSVQNNITELNNVAINNVEVNETNIDTREINDTEINKMLNKLSYVSLNNILDECIDEKTVDEITDKIISKIFKK